MLTMSLIDGGVVEEDLDPVDAALLGLDPDVDVEDLGGHVRALRAWTTTRPRPPRARSWRRRSRRSGPAAPSGSGAPSPSLSVSVSSSEMVPPWTSTTLPDVEDRLADVVGPELDVAGRDHLLLLDRGPAGRRPCRRTGTPPRRPRPPPVVPPSAGAGASAALLGAAHPASPSRRRTEEQPLRRTRTTAAPAASAVRRKERVRRVATMATRTATRKGRFRPCPNRDRW